MKYRKLGKDGFEVSEVGLGCWQLGGDWGKDFNEQQAFEIFETALEYGTTLFDTADVYGDGNSEKFIGDYMQQTGRTDIRVVTKLGRNAKLYPDNYTKDSLRWSIEQSLERLQVSSLDLVQLHCIPTIELEKGNVFEWLRELKQEGLIKHFGASVESVDEALICLLQDEILSLQVIFNIFRQKLVTELLPKAQEKGVGILARVPLASGVLTGKFTPQHTFNKSDHRNFNKDGELFNVGETFAGVPFEKGVAFAERIKEWIPEGLNLTRVALRWVLDHEAVSTVIPGASSGSQAKENALISELPPLDAELYVKLKTLYQEEIHDEVRGVY